MLEDTGERVIPDQMEATNRLLIEHVARYQFATSYVYGKVLDFACGSGYGTHLIVKSAKKQVEQVVGIDFDRDAIAYAKNRYYHPASEFIQGDVTDPNLPSKLGQFDCIMSFETIEHIDDEKQFLNNIDQLLKPGGRLILSTPFGDGRDRPSGVPFHVHQLTINEFKRLFDEFAYQSVEFFYQNGALIVPEGFEIDQYFPLGIVICQK
ncbi:class I SAM-dependent methyltransferase [Amphibacillus indicireducens]|uniref:Methyltransferase type 11 domain-containing protein n=1 Tax=Amphibacillus indicireducens TaxID=1076330 RepID=A0ABP7VGA1_9BACI